MVVIRFAQRALPKGHPASMRGSSKLAVAFLQRVGNGLLHRYCVALLPDAREGGVIAEGGAGGGHLLLVAPLQRGPQVVMLGLQSVQPYVQPLEPSVLLSSPTYRPWRKPFRAFAPRAGRSWSHRSARLEPSSRR